jgi:hypothetical protein
MCGGTVRRMSISLTLLATLLAAGSVAATPASAAPAGPIASAGPLSSILTTPDLNCAVSHALDSSPEFFGTTACATLVAVGGTLFGPADIPAGGSAAPRTAFTPVSQQGPTGAGTSGDPFRVVTVVSLGESGLLATQTDTYLAGQDAYTTTVELHNATDANVDATVYRAGDCYLENSDVGLGAQAGDWVACVAGSGSGRVEQWVPLTPGSSYMEAGYNEVWAAIGTQQPLPDSCLCDSDIDNGAGLSWSVQVDAGSTARVADLTAFAPSEGLPDTDGDGLPDVWETNGLDLNGDGIPEVDLPAMGADPRHKDIFVEVDWMERPNTHCLAFHLFCSGGRSFRPNQRALDDVRASFDASPVSNPDGSSGIHIHIDSGSNAVMDPVTGAKWGNRSQSGQVPYSQSLGTIVIPTRSTYDWSQYDALKASNFDSARADVFHYALYADTFANTNSSGLARDIPADSFMVTSGYWRNGFSTREESGTFMHELGHTLGLTHGGSIDEGAINGKPNYQSIMNYRWQMGGLPLSYSAQTLATLNEDSLDERAGVGGPNLFTTWNCPGGNAGIAEPGNLSDDWNCNGSIDSVPVIANVNGDEDENGQSLFGTLHGFDDWAHLVLDGGSVGALGAGDPTDSVPSPTLTTEDEPTKDRLPVGNGDGAVRVEGPSTLLVGVPGQSVLVAVENPGAVDAQYTVNYTSDAPGLGAGSQVLSVSAGQTRNVAIGVDANALAVGTAHLSVSLTAPDGTSLASTQADVAIVDPNDPAVGAALRAGLAEMSQPIDGLDEAVRLQVVATISLLPSTPTSTVPSGTPVPSTTPVPPIATPAPALVPAAKLKSAALAARTHVAVPVSWAAAGSGLTYDVQYRSVGLSVKGNRALGSWHTWLSATSSHAATFGASSKPVKANSGSAFELRVRSRSAAGVAGAFSTPVQVSFAFDDRDPALKYSKGWRRTTAKEALAGTESRSTQRNASVTVTAATSRVTVVGARCAVCGVVAVYVDGRRVGTYNGHSKHAANRQVLFSKALHAGRHTIRLVGQGTKSRSTVKFDGIAFES